MWCHTNSKFCLKLTKIHPKIIKKATKKWVKIWATMHFWERVSKCIKDISRLRLGPRVVGGCRAGETSSLNSWNTVLPHLLAYIKHYFRKKITIYQARRERGRGEYICVFPSFGDTSQAFTLGAILAYRVQTKFQ